MKLVLTSRVVSVALVASFVVGCGSADGGGDESLGTSGEDGALTIQGWKEPSADDRTTAQTTYANVDPGHVVPADLLANALAFVVANKEKLDNTDYVTVVDFARHSGKNRFFLINLETGKVEPHVVAHGYGSDPNSTGFAKRFSNVDGSGMSSLGYYVTGETYQGKNGFSLRLDGVSNTNSHVRERAVVIHGASYVSPGRSSQGHSAGCFALADEESSAVIKKLKGGSLIYADRSGNLSEPGE